MRHLVLAILLVAFLSLVGSGGSPDKTGQGEEVLIADYFPIDIGMESVFRMMKGDAESEVVSAFTKIETRANGKQYWELKTGEDISSGYLSDDGLELERMGEAVLSPPILMFRKSVCDGDVITSTTTMQSPGETRQIVFTCQVVGVNDPGTSAGILDNSIQGQRVWLAGQLLQYVLYTKPASSTVQLGSLRQSGWLAKGIGLAMADEYAPGEGLVSRISLLATRESARFQNRQGAGLHEPPSIHGTTCSRKRTPTLKWRRWKCGSIGFTGKVGEMWRKCFGKGEG